MNITDMVSYKLRLMSEFHEEQNKLEQWWGGLPADRPLTKRDLQPIYESQHWVLYVGANREAADMSHIHWRNVSVRQAIRERVVSLIKGKFRRRFVGLHNHPGQ